MNTNDASMMRRLALDGVGLTIAMEDTLRPLSERGPLRKRMYVGLPS